MNVVVCSLLFSKPYSVYCLQYPILNNLFHYTSRDLLILQINPQTLLVCQATDIMSNKVGIWLLLLVVQLIFLNIYVALLPRDIDNNMQIMQGVLYDDQPRMIQAQVYNNNKQGKDIHTFLSDLSSAAATTTMNKNGTCRF